MGKPWLVTISDDLSISHFVISFPGLPTPSENKKLFRFSQVGMFSPPSTCTFFEMPRYAIWRQSTSKFYEISGDECATFEELSICGPSLKIDDTSCVQIGEISCPLTQISCDTVKNSYSYVVTLSGVLMRNNKPLSTFIEQKMVRLK